MQGLVLAEGVKVGDVVAEAMKKGLVVISASGNVLRLVPPLIITESDIDQMYSILSEILL